MANITTTLNAPFFLERALVLAQPEDGDSSSSSSGNWAAGYPECEYTIQIGIPPLVVEKTVKSSYRNVCRAQVYFYTVIPFVV